MLEHLLNFKPEVGAYPTDFMPIEKAGIDTTIDAKVNTIDWLHAHGVKELNTLATEQDTQAARKSFANIVSAAPQDKTHQALAEVKTPQAVQHLVSMLTAYDWEFVEQAKQLRGYAVAKILEEVENPSANIRLKALGMLGKITEVGLFTDKIEVQKTEMSDVELDQRIKEKLNKFMDIADALAPTDDITDISINGFIEHNEPDAA
jgi:phosphoglycerate-specific signal transduction histidine kinase